MTGGFWTGIAIGAVLSFLASVLANLSHDRVSLLLRTWKSGVSERRRAYELKTFNRLRDIHEGRKDRLGLFVDHILSFVLYTVFGVGVLNALLITGASGKVDPFIDGAMSGELKSVLIAIGFVVCCLFGFYMLTLSAIELALFHRDKYRLENFEDYKAEIEGRFGPQPTL